MKNSKALDLLISINLTEDPEERKKLQQELRELRSSHKEIGLDSRICSVLVKIGVPSHTLGKQYIAASLKILVSEPEKIHSMTKELYPRVARMFGSTTSRVERAIRHAVEYAWNNGDLEFTYGIFGNTVPLDSGKPTNSQFLARLSEYLREEGDL